MSGLILKDIYNMKRTIRSIIIIMVFFAFTFVPNYGVSGYISMCTILFSNVILSSMSIDGLARWDEFALTMPVTRRQIVMSKYALFILFSVSGLIISIFAGSVFSIFFNSFDAEELLASCAVGLLLPMFFGSLTIPAVFKFGVERARYIMMAVFLLPAAAFIILSQLVDEINLPEIGSQTLAIAGITAAAVIVLMFVGSYFLSASIYGKKEF